MMAESGGKRLISRKLSLNFNKFAVSESSSGNLSNFLLLICNTNAELILLVQTLILITDNSKICLKSYSKVVTVRRD